MTVCYWCGAKDTLADIGKELDDGKYKMVQCSKCKNAYYVLNKEKINKPKPQTNEEYLHSLNTEQLAEEIVNMTLLDRYKLYDQMESAEYEHGIGIGAKKVIAEWLKQPHKEQK